MFGHRLTLFDLFGFKVHIDPSWLLLAALIVWSLAVGYFPFAAPGFAAATYWWMALAGLLGLALSIVVHELAHSLVARRFDMPIAGITLFAFGGVAEMTEEPTSPKGEFLMAIAGPLMSVAVSAVLWGVATLAVGMGADGGNPAMVVLSYLSLLNLLLAAFNMIPAFPLDGGRVLRAALWAWRKDVLWATRMAAASGTLFGLALVGWGIYSTIAGSLVTGIWWLLIGLFVRAAAAQAYQQQLARRLLSGQAVARLMKAEPVTVPPELTLDRLVEDYVYRFAFKSFPVAVGERLVGCVSLDVVKAVPRGEWPLHTVAEVMEGCGGATIPDTADAAEALARMRRGGRTRLMVTSGGRLVGVLSLRDLLAYLSLKDEVESAQPAGSGMRKVS
jgi:Zn-dependent protease/CBS domain-containing protein